MEKLNTHSPDVTAQNVAKLAELFPNCVTESKDDKGNLKRVIDFDLLRQELSAGIVESSKERYRLDWPGKREALITANKPIDMTLRPYRGESVDFDTTQNLFIEGDNLDALKLLQETYLGKVKMIYIDPPYNTGKDFIYKDKFAESAKEYHLESGQKDEEGNRLVANTDSNGRFHSDWLSMMYPRLKLARNLLKDNGVIFISIDDGEQANLKRICDEIFGAENFVANVIWEKKYAPQNDAKWLSDSHDYVLVYGRSKDNWRPIPLPRSEKQRRLYRNRDNDPRGDWKPDNLLRKEEQKTGLYSIVTPSGRECRPRSGTSWRVPEYRLKELVADNRIWFGEKGDNVPSLKRFVSEIKDGVTPITIWKYEDVGHNQEATKQLRSLFDSKAYFDTPKPLRLLQRMLRISTAADDDDIVLDFFAGSATTAHAVMQLNAEDGGQRKFIMIQLPEKCDEKTEALKAGYENIAEISKERIRRAGKKIKEENAEMTANLDIGFRVLKIDTSNMVDIENTPDVIEQGQLQNFIENIKPGRGSEDLLFQVLLNWGVDLTQPITAETVKGLEVFFVDKNALVACFAPDGQITEDLCKELATRKPLRVVFRDSGFENDSVKVNVEQIFKLLSPGTDVKTI